MPDQAKTKEAIKEFWKDSERRVKLAENINIQEVIEILSATNKKTLNAIFGIIKDEYHFCYGESFSFRKQDSHIDQQSLFKLDKISFIIITTSDEFYSVAPQVKAIETILNNKKYKGLLKELAAKKGIKQLHF